ncbi:MAG: CoA transferase [Ramlibacter sp.]|nr:CoA transferase [Ramlibacter sp.]
MGPLAGLKIVEFAAVGPAPMCAMLLADLGATVMRIDRSVAVELGSKRPLEYDLLLRNREVMALDLKSPEGRAMAMDVVAGADALIEGFRPGVMERLGLGPAQCLDRNPKLVYGRMTGWGQTGPLAQAAAHDVNFIALTGALDSIGRKGEPPSIPLNLLGDYAGGSLYLAMGILAALQEAGRSGKGQVVDAAIVDGVMSLMTSVYGVLGAGIWKEQRGANVADSGSPFYNVYQCADGKYISIAPIEERFYGDMLERIGFDAAQIPDRWDRSGWDRAKELFAAKFKTRTRQEWCDLLEGTDACFAPVLAMSEVMQHPHMKARGSLVEVAGVQQPPAAPRFSRSTPETPRPPRTATRDEALASLRQWFGEPRYAELEKAGRLQAVQASSGG